MVEEEEEEEDEDDLDRIARGGAMETIPMDSRVTPMSKVARREVRFKDLENACIALACCVIESTRRAAASVVRLLVSGVAVAATEMPLAGVDATSAYVGNEPKLTRETSGERDTEGSEADGDVSGAGSARLPPRRRCVIFALAGELACPTSCSACRVPPCGVLEFFVIV